MEIRHEERGRGGRFVAGEGEDQAEMTYAPGGREGVLVFDHTYVPRSLRGQGIAEALVERGVAHARERGLSVVPACSYVRALFDRHPERYAAIRAEG